jgi:hypothetical protein
MTVASSRTNCWRPKRKGFLPKRTEIATRRRGRHSPEDDGREIIPAIAVSPTAPFWNHNFGGRRPPRRFAKGLSRPEGRRYKCQRSFLRWHRARLNQPFAKGLASKFLAQDECGLKTTDSAGGGSPTRINYSASPRGSGCIRAVKICRLNRYIKGQNRWVVVYCLHGYPPGRGGP